MKVILQLLPFKLIIPGEGRYRFKSVPSGSKRIRFSAMFLLLTVLLFGMHPDAPAQLPVAGDTSGYTAGNSRVTDGGAFTYSVPVVCAPGSAGMKPSISFGYSSQSGNGLIGMGISLDGFSSISRSVQTRAQDGRATGISLSPADRFVLDGDRLIITDETAVYGGNNTSYRLEQNTMSRITAFGTAAGPDYFRVEDKSGLISEYGNTADSKVKVQNGTIIHWLVNRISDRFGNYMLFQYFQNPATGEYYPVSVTYTGNINNAVLPYASIQFEYEPRADSATRYLNGQRTVSLTKRLKFIRCLYRNTPYRSYQFNYQYSPAGLSQLRSFRECGKNGSCNWPTVLRWSNNDSMSFTPVAVPGLETGGGQNKLIAADIASNSVMGFVKIIPGSNLQAYISNRNYAAPAFTQVSFSPAILINRKTVFCDPNGDTRQDILVYDSVSGASRICINTRQNNAPDIPNNALASGIPPALLTGRKTVFSQDLNFDGRTDFIIIDDVNGNNHIFYSNSTGYNTISFFQNGSLNYFTNLMPASLLTGNWDFEITDLNDDGYPDLFFYNLVTGGTSIYRNNGGDSPSFQPVATNVVPAAAINSTSGKLYFGDHGRDGLPDLLFYIQQNGTNRWWTNRGDFTFVSVNASPANLSQQLTGGDLMLQTDHNEDGILDLLWLNKTTGENRWLINDGRLNFVPLPTELIPRAELMGYDLQSAGNFTSRSSLDLFLYSETRTPKVKILKGRPAANSLVTEITNGNADQVTITYDLLTNDSLNVKYDDAVYPLVDYHANQMVVKSIEHLNGTGTKNRVSYQLKGLRLMQNGRGYRGASEVQETDEATGITEVRTYLNDTAAYKYAGAPITGETRKLVNGTVLTRREIRPGIKSYLNNRSFSGYEQRTITKNYELDGTLIDSMVQQFEYDDNMNLTRSITEYSDGRKDSMVNQFADQAAGWILGRLTRTELYRIRPGGSSIVKTSEFGYDGITGAMNVEKIQPDSSQEQRVTHHSKRDTWGNITEDSLVGWDGDVMTARVTLTRYDNLGRFAIAKRDAGGFWTYFTYDSLLGHLTSFIDQNGHTTTYTQDNMGREYKTTYPDGSWTQKDYRFCGSVAPCPPNGSQLIYKQFSGKAPEITYYDIKNRKVREETTGFDGRTVLHDFRYDARGVLTEETDKYFRGDQPDITYTFSDANGRPVKVIRPGNRTDSIIYRARMTTLINSKGQRKISETDVHGNITRITDDEGNTVLYEFDGANQLTGITDPEGNRIQWTVDSKSRVIRETDPDRGLTVNRYNAFDELTHIIHNQDTIRQRFDKLGRMKERIEKEGTTRNYYDGQAAGKGLADSIVAPGCSEYIIRDNGGRIQSHGKKIDGKVYLLRMSYDSQGRLIRISDPGGFTRLLNYNAYGYLSEVVDSATGRFIYRIEAANADGQTTRLLLKNGVQQFYTYNNQTGYLVHIAARKGALVLQDISVNYDELGNVTSRRDNLLNKEEFFEFDRLNRLTRSLIPGIDTLTLTYNSIGNILYNSAVGTYQYGTVNNGPHRLTGVTGNNSSCIPSLQVETVYNSFDKVKEIRKDSVRIAVTYDANRQRTKQVLYDSSQVKRIKLYLFQGVEAEIINGDTIYNHITGNAEGPVASFFTRQGSAQRTEIFYHKDHLGSIVLTTGDTGQVVGRFSYNVWGMRRNADWTRGNPDSTALPAQRGYTGHEHYELFNLIDCNGRIYDPVLARFLSPDPLLEDITNLQLLNRYSYCGNNPVTFSDPSGFSLWKKIKSFIVKKVQSLLKSAFMKIVKVVVLNYLTGGTYAIFSAAASSFASGFLSTIFNGGSFRDAFRAGLKGGLISGLTAGLNIWAGIELPQSFLVQTVSHAVIQGGASVLQGGNFFDGFRNDLIQTLASAATKEADQSFNSFNKRLLANLVIGGTRSELTGGSFINGAASQSFGFLFDKLKEGEKISFLGYSIQKLRPGPMFKGIDIYETNMFGGGITLPGIGIFFSGGEDLLKHEYGHYLQQQRLKAEYGAAASYVLFYLKYGIPSFLNAVFFDERTHRRHPVETNANRHSNAYFGGFQKPELYPLY